MDKIKSFTSRWSLKDGGEEAREPTARRKEQIRRAQQAYRQRKDGYVKSLEAEVIHLRTCRSDLLGETRKLTTEIEWLRDIVKEHHIILPPPPDAISSPSQPRSPVSSTTVCVSRDYLNNRRLIVQEATPSIGSSPSSIQHGNNDGHLAPMIHQGDVVAGMNFILSLEGPCLDHVRSALDTPDAPSGHGHALTLTASVFRLYGESSLQPEEDQLLNVSRETLRRLLELSSQLPTEDELTPIQIWAFLCQSPWAADAQPGRMMAIAGSLLHHIKCHGYGAVIPREIVMNTLAEVIQTQTC
ncbi:hypothetical protein BDW59DRAFT_152499 [Aspergillus cavernicola]|uniref:BZIP domain-containing protein n=1 Tax=Aspergillus cavernicola TaxID=176166 RepID=A0ABR4HQR5_9EURO